MPSRDIDEQVFRAVDRVFCEDDAGACGRDAGLDDDRHRGDRRAEGGLAWVEQAFFGIEAEPYGANRFDAVVRAVHADDAFLKAGKGMCLAVFVCRAGADGPFCGFGLVEGFAERVLERFAELNGGTCSLGRIMCAKGALHAVVEDGRRDYETAGDVEAALDQAREIERFAAELLPDVGDIFDGICDLAQGDKIHCVSLQPCLPHEMRSFVSSVTEMMASRP